MALYTPYYITGSFFECLSVRPVIYVATHVCKILMSLYPNDCHSSGCLQSIFLSVCLRLSVSVCLSVCPSVRLFSCMCVCVSVCNLSVCPLSSVFPSVFLSVRMSVCLPVYMHVCLSICLSVCLPTCLSVRLSICMYVCPSVYHQPAFLPVCLSFPLAVCLSNSTLAALSKEISMSLHLHVFPFIIPIDKATQV